MNPQTQSTPSVTESSDRKPGLPRSSHRTPAGRHCRAQARDSRSGLCPRHYFRPPDHRPDPQLAAELLGPTTDFQSAEDVRDFLSRLLILLAQDRLSPRRAAVMIYGCNQLLRSLRAIDLEALAAETRENVPGHKVIFELTGPGEASAGTQSTPVKPS